MTEHTQQVVGASIPYITQVVPLNANNTKNRDKAVQVEYFVEEGFIRVPAGGIKTFRGRETESGVVFLSITTVEGDVIAVNSSHARHSNVIVTPDKCVVDGVSWSTPWTDLNGVTYYCSSCKSLKPCTGHDES